MKEITWVPATESLPGYWCYPNGKPAGIAPNFRAFYGEQAVIVFHPPKVAMPFVCTEGQLDILDFGDKPIILAVPSVPVIDDTMFIDGVSNNLIRITPPTKQALTDHLNSLTRFGMKFITPDMVSIYPNIELKCYQVAVEGFGNVGAVDKPIYDTVKLFEVWVEGYQAQGNHGCARLEGQAVAGCFRDACALVMTGNQYYNPAGNTWWGCRLFDNEQDARKAFG
jgi:hypothetical protein